MKNLCQIFSQKTKKGCAFALVLCLMWGVTPAAESISVKLRGKIALGGILTGLAYATHALIKRDKRAVEQLKLHLGPPERVIQFERGFDLWRIHYYAEQYYMFRNNRFIKSAHRTDLHSGHQTNTRRETCACKFVPPFLIDTPVLGYPTWSRLCLSHLQRAPQPGSSYLYRSVDARLLDPGPWLSH